MSEKQYIELEAVLDYIRNRAPIPSNAVGAVYVDIKAFPAAPVREVVRGKWEKRVQILRIKSTNIPEITCSVCGEYFCDIVKKHDDFYNFCPNCGADMREPVADIDDGHKEEGGLT